jgi:hypothetical protein
MASFNVLASKGQVKSVTGIEELNSMMGMLACPADVG